MAARFLEIKRLYLRDFSINDFAAVHEYGSIPDFLQYELWGPIIKYWKMRYVADETIIGNRKIRGKIYDSYRYETSRE